MCGIIGLYGDQEAAEKIWLGLYAQQHRGQEAWGVITSDGRSYFPNFLPHKIEGLVIKEAHLEKENPFHLDGHIGIGHVRYSTQGINTLENAQPHFAHLDNNHDPSGKRIYLAANGDITNLKYLRGKLKVNGIEVNTTNDGEVLVKIIGLNFKKTNDIILAIFESMTDVDGAFAAVLMDKNTLYAFRDLHGFRPLVMGKNSNGAILFASETCALDMCEFQFVREVKPGEIVEVNNQEIHYHQHPKKLTLTQCIFELIYFSKPDSKIFGCSVAKFREGLGKNLAKLSLTETGRLIHGNNIYTNCLVSAIPDSSNQAALGFANYLGPLPFGFALIRSHYTGRTFIKPDQHARDFDAKMKFAADQHTCRDTNIILVDDSIVRGTTMKQIISMIRKAGAKSVHLRIASPPIKFSCHMGINTHEQSELIAAKNNEEEIGGILGADRLIYNTIDNLKLTARECGLNPDHFCYACFDGNYPCPIPDYQ